MRVLSVRQPWASLIASGRKTIELRSRPTSYRGPVIIAAGSRPWDGEHSYELGPLGVVVCVVELVDCRPAVPSDETRACVAPHEGWWAWELRDARPLKPMPHRGQLGLYRAPEELVRAASV